MPDVDIPQIVLDAFRARSSREGDTIRLVMTGTADTDTKASLDDLFSRVHAAALAAGTRAVVVDLSGLEFMNSSSLKAFLTWFRLLRDTNAVPYQVEIRTSAQVYWQRRSIQALVAFAPEHVSQVEA